MTTPPEPVIARHPIDEPVDRIGRFLLIVLAAAWGGLMLSGLVLSLASRVVDVPEKTQEVVVAVLGGAGLLALLALVQLPMSGFLVAMLRGQRRSLSDRLRLAATASAIAVVWCGWIVGASRMPGGVAVGAAVFALGALALPAALVPPRVRSPDIGRRLLVLLLPPGLLVMSSYASTSEKAYLAAMKSDLRNYVTWQDRQRATSGRYAPAPDSSVPLSAGVTLVEASADSDRFLARVRHRGVEATCAIFVGAAPTPPAVVEGEPACTTASRRELFAVGLFYLAGAALVTALVAWRMPTAQRRARNAGGAT